MCSTSRISHMLQRRRLTMVTPASTKIPVKYWHLPIQLFCSSEMPPEPCETPTTRLRRASYNSDFVLSSKIGRGEKNLERVFILKARSTFFEATESVPLENFRPRAYLLLESNWELLSYERKPGEHPRGRAAATSRGITAID